MVELIDTLLDKGNAYVADDGSGDVYFDVRSWPSYGELTHQRLDDMAPADDADPRGKRDPRDFALWKGAKPDEPASASWPAPYGRGRPAGTSSARRWPASTWATRSTSTAGASTFVSRTTRTSRRSRARRGWASRSTGCTTGG
jgi:cysteinyl-tRNA synthetase